MTEPTVHEVLVAAREVLQEGGWCRWDFRDENGAHCLIGAVNTVLYGQEIALGGPAHAPQHTLKQAAVEAIWNAVPRRYHAYSDAYTGVACFNDSRKGVAPVLRVIDRAIKATA